MQKRGIHIFMSYESWKPWLEKKLTVHQNSAGELDFRAQIRYDVLNGFHLHLLDFPFINILVKSTF